MEYLLSTHDDSFDWTQLVASRRLLSVTEEELRRIVLDIHDGPVQKIFASLNVMVHLRATADATPATKNRMMPLLLPDMIRVIDMLELSLREIRTFLGIPKCGNGTA